jgi:uncharacterized protein (DUF1499 family)
MKVGRIKFAIKEISIAEVQQMDVDEGSQAKCSQVTNIVESVEDDEFFEFEEVESIMNAEEEESYVAGSHNEQPSCRFCWSSSTEIGNPLISSC